MPGHEFKIASKCEHCHRTYSLRRHNKINAPYCTAVCKNRATADKIQCKNCPKFFRPTKASQVYCCQKCAADFSARHVQAASPEPKIPTAYTIYKRDNFQCIYCGASAHDGAKLTIDHIYPQSLGGRHDVFNLATCCHACNSHKQDKPFTEKKTIALWSRNKQLDIKFGNITSYETLAIAFEKHFRKR